MPRTALNIHPNNPGKIEPPEAGHDVRNYGTFFAQVAAWLNRTWEIKPGGNVLMSDDKVVIDLGGLGFTFNVASNGVPATVKLLALTKPQPIA